MLEKKNVKIVGYKTLDLLLGLTIFLIPFYFIRFKILGIPTNIFELGVLLLLIATLMQATITKKQYPVNNQTQKDQNHKTFNHYSLFIILFFLSFLMGSSKAGYSLDSLGIVKSYFVVPVVLGLAISYQLSAFRGHINPKPITQNLKPIFFGFYLSLLIVSLWAILQKFGILTTLFYQVGDISFNQYLGDNFRAFGPFESPNYLAMYIVPILFLTIGIMQNAKCKMQKIWKVMFNLTLILPLIALIFTKSRAGIIALAVSLSLLLIFWIYQNLKSKAGKVIIISGSLILYSVFLILVTKYGLRPETDSARFEIYSYSWQMIVENPIFGIGLGGFQNYLSAIPISVSFREIILPYAYHPHNLYMSLWLNVGLLGLISFIGIVVCVIGQYFVNNPGKKRLNNAGIFMILALVSILIHGILDTTYFKNDLSAIFWVTIALILTQTDLKLAGRASSLSDK